MENRPIGIFDSGLGGLTILKTLSRVLPHEQLIYFGDTMNVPYGAKSKAAVTRFSLDIARFLQQQNVKLIVVACNTASALALPELKKQIPLPILGVIDAGARQALRRTRNGHIAVIATEATVKSEAYPKALHQLQKSVRTVQRACPLFVPLIEEGWQHPAAGEAIIADYLRPLVKSGADTLILGCTHYPVIKHKIAKYTGKQIQLVDAAQAVAEEVTECLTRSGQLRTSGRGGLRIYASDDTARFKRLAKHILGKPLTRVWLKKLN